MSMHVYFKTTMTRYTLKDFWKTIVLNVTKLFLTEPLNSSMHLWLKLLGTFEQSLSGLLHEAHGQC